MIVNDKNRVLLFLFFCLFSFVSISGQKSERSVEVEGWLKGTDDKPLSETMVSYDMGRKQVMTNTDGYFNFKTELGDYVNVYKEGYNQISVEATSIMNLVLELKNPFSEKIALPYNKMATTQSVTAPVTLITGEELSRYPTSNLLEALTGKIPNAKFIRTDNSPGSTGLEFTIRGFVYTMIVDGVTRSFENLSADEVESVSVLRGMSARAMYGYTGAHGVIVVKTKHGVKGKKEISANVEYGAHVVNQNRLPEWLGAYDYATMRNKAAINDGADPNYFDNLPYSPEYLDGYRTGSNPLKYVDEDLYSQIFNNAMEFKRISLNYGGGSKSTNYFFNLNYVGEGNNYLKNKDNSFDQIRLRSNVDVDITEDFKFTVGAVAGLQFRKYPLDMDNVWSVLEKYPVNAYPVEIGADTFGTHASYSTNPVADIIKRNYNRRYDSDGQVNVGFEYSFDKFISGLSMDAFMSYDIYNYQTISTEEDFTYAKYVPIWELDALGQDSMSLIKYGEDKSDAGQSRIDDSFTSRVGAFVNVNYLNNFGKHQLGSSLNGALQSYTEKGTAIDDRRLNYSLFNNYVYDSKYYVDFILSLTGSQKLSIDNRYKLFPTIGLGWMVSEERFMANMSAIDALKLRASYGQQGYLNISENFLYNTEWKTYGNATFDKEPDGVQAQSLQRVYVDHDGNPDLSWGTVAEFDIGIDAMFLENRLTIQMDYYNMMISGIVQDAMLPSIMGLSGYYDNTNKNKYSGADASVTYTNKIADFAYSIGGNVGYSISEVITDNLPEYNYEWLNHEGRPKDAIYSFNALGLFVDETDIMASPEQTYGAVLPGNIKYEDLNGDGKVTSNYDKEMIGHTNPRFTYGLNFNLRYKGIQLYALGYGVSCRDIDVQSNPYFHTYGNNKYSQYVGENAWTLGDNENSNALHPRLTSESVRNDNLTSTYWLRNGAFFKIKNLELSYDLPQHISKKLLLTNVKVFIRGVNLMTFSEIDGLDPESLSMGVSTYPSMRTFTGGLNLKF